MNRIEQAIVDYRKMIAVKNVDESKLAELNRKLDMKLDEYALFQELKSLAVADGTLSADEGMTVYGYLGEAVSVFNGQELAVKCVLTKLFQELMTKRIGV